MRKYLFDIYDNSNLKQTTEFISNYLYTLVHYADYFDLWIEIYFAENDLVVEPIINKYNCLICIDETIIGRLA